MSKIKLKNGMGGKGKRDPTSVLKARSKKRRRVEGKQKCKEST